jgi:hypothetical protein
MNKQSKTRSNQKAKRKPLAVRDLIPQKDSQGGAAEASGPSKVLPASLQDFFKSDSFPIKN